jgi:hypothetical protein
VRQQGIIILETTMNKNLQHQNMEHLDTVHTVIYLINLILLELTEKKNGAEFCRAVLCKGFCWNTRIQLMWNL